MTDLTKIDKRIEEIEQMVSIREAFYALWDLMQKGVEIDIDIHYDSVIMGAKVKVIKYIETPYDQNKIDEFKTRINVMCDQIELTERVPDCRPARTLYISDNQVGLGDCTMTVTPAEMNEILRFIAKGGKF